MVIGEGEATKRRCCISARNVGAGDGPEVDIAVDPLEGTTLCAKALPNALAVLAIAEGGTLLNVPDIYMDKIAIGPGFRRPRRSRPHPRRQSAAALADAKGVPFATSPSASSTAPRHAKLIEEVRAAGAAISLIGDGDIAGVIQTAEPHETGIDIYIGIGGAPEGVLAAPRCAASAGRFRAV